jgi:hypothetical protein
VELLTTKLPEKINSAERFSAVFGNNNLKITP